MAGKVLMGAVHSSLLAGLSRGERPATAVPGIVRVRSRGPAQIWGTHSGGTEDRHAMAQSEAEGRVRVVRVEPGGGGATVRRFVESGRATGGVRAWSQAARGEDNVEIERARNQGPRLDLGAAAPGANGNN